MRKETDTVPTLSHAHTKALLETNSVLILVGSLRAEKRLLLHLR